MADLSHLNQLEKLGSFRPTTAALSIESHSQLYVKMRIILIKFIWHLRCFYHLAPDLQASSLY